MTGRKRMEFRTNRPAAGAALGGVLAILLTCQPAMAGDFRAAPGYAGEVSGDVASDLVLPPLPLSFDAAQPIADADVGRPAVTWLPVPARKPQNPDMSVAMKTPPQPDLHTTDDFFGGLAAEHNAAAGRLLPDLASLDRSAERKTPAPSSAGAGKSLAGLSGDALAHASPQSQSYSLDLIFSKSSSDEVGVPAAELARSPLSSDEIDGEMVAPVLGASGAAGASEAHGAPEAETEVDPASETHVSPSIVAIAADFREARGQRHELEGLAPADSTPAEAEIASGDAEALGDAKEPGDEIAVLEPADRGAVDLDQAGETSAETAAPGVFARIWVDGDRHGSDPFVKFYPSGNLWFADAKSCMDAVVAEAGLAIAPSGQRPVELQAFCIGVAPEVASEVWFWRERSGARSRSVLTRRQAALMKSVVANWSDGSVNSAWLLR